MSEPNRNPNRAPILVRLSEVEPEPIRWLWPSRVPLGKLTLIAGNPGEGKSMMTMDIAARVSSGLVWPDGTEACPGSVIVMNAEDDIADTIRPRLDAAGGDARRVVALTGMGPKGRERSVTIKDIEAIESTLHDTPDTRLIVIDPVSAYLGGAEFHDNGAIRGLLAPLATLASESGAAIVLITHNRKGHGSALHRAIGSLAFTGAARMHWLVARHPHDGDQRVLARVKGNVGRDPGGLAFRIIGDRDEDARVEWQPGRVDFDPDELVADDQRSEGTATRRDNAAAWLREALHNGPVPSEELKRRAEAEGIAWRTIERAKETIGVRIGRVGGRKCHYEWGMDQGPPTPPLCESGTPDTKLGGLGGVRESEAVDSELDEPRPNYWSKGA